MPEVTRSRAAHSAAHRRSLEQSVNDLVEALTEKLGSKLVAFIADKDQSTISRWKNGTVEPSEEALRPLRVTFQIFEMLEAAESDHTIRAWFIGMNPQLNDDSPAEALAEGRSREVMAAARAFLAGG